MRYWMLLLLLTPALFGQAFSEPEHVRLSCPSFGSPAVADFNDDGLMDFAAANIFMPYLDGSFILRLGCDQGGFRAGPRQPVIGSGGKIPLPRCITAGDYDGDGKTDVACADNLGRLWLFAGRGTGEFDLPVMATDGFKPGSFLQAVDWNLLTSIDWDGDGRDEILGQFSILDLKTYISHEPLTVYRLKENWKLESWLAVSIHQVRAFARADLDGDGTEEAILSAADPTELNLYSRPSLYIWDSGSDSGRIRGPFSTVAAPTSIAVHQTQDSPARLLLASEDGPCQLVAVDSQLNFSTIQLFHGSKGSSIFNFARFCDLDGRDGPELLLLEHLREKETRVVTYRWNGKGRYEEHSSREIPGLCLEKGDVMVERACLRDMTHDGNPDLLSLCLLPDSMSMVFLENRAPFHHGFRYIHTPWSGAEPRLAAVGGPVVAGNRDFRLRLVGAEGGFLVWNLLAWPPNDPLLVGTTALNVPPRLLFPMGKEFELPIPHDARFQGPLGNHYFQWLSPKLDRVSGILNLRFHP